MNEKSDSKWLSLATVSILGQPPSLSFCPSSVLWQQLRSQLCACCHALKTNNNPTPVAELIPCAFLRALNHSFAFIFLLSLSTGLAVAESATALVHNISIEQVNAQSENAAYQLSADIQYKLSPIAKEALDEGISLTWWVIIKVQQRGFFWDTTKKKIEIGYQIQNHELLNLYSVKNINKGTTDMFSTLKAAFNSISKIRDLQFIDTQSVQQGEGHYVAIKVLFDREALPVPLRPMSYFQSQWTLSSPWVLWPLQN